MEELLAFNYSAPCVDRRDHNGGEGEQTTFREFLGDEFFDELQKLQAAGVERVVFWFDN